jgi:quinol monooxygenase YgiN
MPVEIEPPSAAVMALEQSSLHVDIWIDPSNLAKWFEEFQKTFDLVVAEPECTYFEVFQDPDEPGHLRWVENWNASTVWVATVSLSTMYC